MNGVGNKSQNKTDLFLLTGDYKSTFGSYGCEKSLPPPSSENKICEKFHEKIGQLKKDKNRKDLDDDFVKEFLKNSPTESLLIPTEDIRFEGVFDRPQF